MSFLETLLMPFQFDFMVNALIISVQEPVKAGDKFTQP